MLTSVPSHTEVIMRRNLVSEQMGHPVDVLQMAAHCLLKTATHLVILTLSVNLVIICLVESTSFMHSLRSSARSRRRRSTSSCSSASPSPSASPCSFTVETRPGISPLPSPSLGVGKLFRAHFAIATNCYNRNSVLKVL